MGRISAALLGALVSLTVFILGAGPASAALSDVPTPTVTGPVPVTADSTPWSATDKPLDDYGYVEDEYFYGGDAYGYDTSGAVDQTGSRITTGGPADDGSYPYETRMIVRRPTDPDDFNGTVIVEWLNVTASFDLEANWFGDPEYLLDNGYAYVGVSAQRVGVNWLRAWDADRYGALDVSARNGATETITNDALSYDIYAAAIKALLDEGDGVDPLGTLPKPDTVIASGESQSGSRLSTYYNKVQPIHDVVDAFLITVSSGAIRHDTATPAIRILSETENRIPRTEEDAANYRQWEVAGGSHLPRMAFENFQAPIERDVGLTLSANCLKYPLSRVQWPYVVNSAYEHLVDWANGGPAPPIAPRGIYQASPEDPNNQLERDENGIAEGGIRLPEMSVPARLNTGVNAADPGGGGIFSGFCGLLGSTEDLTDSILLSRYDDWADYVDQVSVAAQQVADDGFILDQDVPRLIQQHKEVPNLRPTAPKRDAGRGKNNGEFTIGWRGTEAPQTVFEVEHSGDGGTTWSGVEGADELTEPSYEFTGGGEVEGEWTYRVRSHTTIPADAARDEYVITTPWSESSGPTIVDRTAPKLKLGCPRKVAVGKRAFVRISASDQGVGLRKDPSGKRRIRTGREGTQRIGAKAVDRAGNKTAKSCKVRVAR